MDNQNVCKEFEPELILYYYDECPAEERKRIEAHLQSCSPCSAFLVDLGRVLPLTVKSDEPSETFWQNYSREVRLRIAALEEKPTWWRDLLDFFRRAPIPAMATAIVLLLAVTLTVTRGIWTPSDKPPTDDKQLLEMISMGQNFEFLKTMDLLDSMDLLEAMGGPGNGST